jgi:L-asparaginase
MAYTASALFFLLQNLNKPVVITGSQLPIINFRTDGINNLVDSLKVATLNIPEVVLCFGSFIYRGSRVSKTHSDNFQAYESPNFHYLGHIGVTINLNKYLLNKKTTKKLDTLKTYVNKKIFLYTIFPEHNALYLEKLTNLKLDALIIHGYGIGNVPSDKSFLDVIKKINESGTIVVAGSQCLYGRVDLTTYETGLELKEIGIVEVADMTLEAIYSKLCYLLNKYKDKNIIVKKLGEVKASL